jgi:hypothetical protein
LTPSFIARSVFGIDGFNTSPRFLVRSLPVARRLLVNRRAFPFRAAPIRLNTADLMIFDLFIVAVEASVRLPNVFILRF